MDQFTLTRPAPGYLRATFDHPPMNFLTPDTIRELREVLGEMHDGAIRVVVFDSVNPDFFMAPAPVRRSPGCSSSRRSRPPWPTPR
jgi:enoyl-CoA hydratase/carnithine racemase